MRVTFASVCVAATSAAFALGSVGRVFAQATAPSGTPEVAETASASAAAVGSSQPTPAASAAAPAHEAELVVPPDCEPGFGMKDGRCQKCDPPCPAGAACAGGLVCVPGAPTVTCKKGSILVHGECVRSERVLSRKQDVCDPPCASGKVCRGPNRCGPPERNPYLHDGVYFRFGAGVGVGGVSKKADGFERQNGAGLAPAFELALGGAPTPGFVFGVGVYGASIIDASGVSNSFGYATLVGSGPFVDVYPIPRENFHIQAALTYNTLWLSTAQIDSNPTPYCPTPCNIPRQVEFDGSGLGLMWGVGFEGWTSSQFAAGVLFRFQYFSTTVVADNAPFPNATASIFIPAFLLTITAQ